MQTDSPKLDTDELRAELARRRMTVCELARRAGLSRSYSYQIVGGFHPSGEVVNRILNVLGRETASRIIAQ